MPALSWEDLDAFLVPDTVGGFATVGVIMLNGGPSLPPINGIFEDETLDAHTGEYMLDLANPRFLCKAADVSDVSKFDTILVGGVVYDLVDDPQNDGTGMATLKLAPTALTV